MRYESIATRVVHGVALFITFSPDEKHNILMLRLSRTRRNDPVNEADELSRRFGGRTVPETSVDYALLGLDVQKLRDRLPTYKERRRMMARDPLACVDDGSVRTALCLWYERVSDVPLLQFGARAGALLRFEREQRYGRRR